jgi:predicted small lipoprotein YifL
MMFTLFAIVGCGDSDKTPATLTPEQKAKQAADEKEVENAENEMQKAPGGIRAKSKK